MMPARVIVFVALAFAAPASAQAPTAECLAQQCERTAAVAEGSAPLWREAAAIHQIKLQFVEAFQRFLRAESGTFGDEGCALADAVESMGTSLSAWERAIAQLETRVARMTPAPEIHFVLATVWLDRHRLDKALRELDTADRSGDRADVHALRALALGALKRPSEAAQSLRRSLRSLSTTWPTRTCCRSSTGTRTSFRSRRFWPRAWRRRGSRATRDG